MEQKIKSGKITVNEDNLDIVITVEIEGDNSPKVINIPSNNEANHSVLELFDESSIMDLVRDKMRRSENLMAIKILKEYHNIGLRQAKEIYDEMKGSKLR